MRKVRIGCGQGYWGDRLDAPIVMVARGEVQYIAFDYLAELTLSIMQRQKQADPARGYATDFVSLCQRILPACRAKGIRLLSSAGGVNPRACLQRVLEVATGLGLNGLRVAAVLGDDILDRLEGLRAQGVSLANMETGQPFDAIRGRVTCANVYLGAPPLVEGLRQGADVIVTGRNTDTSLFMAPMIHELGWPPDDWDRLAAGIVVGHIMECGGQACGGNFGGDDWRRFPALDRVGFPICEVFEDGRAIITKPKGTGGRVSSATVKEELLYELGDPRNYIEPDGVADFTTVRVEDVGRDRVRVWGARGRPAPERLKVSMAYQDGFMAAGQICYSWPDAVAKAKAAEQILRRRFKAVGLKARELRFDLVGLNAIHGPVGGRVPEPDEVMLRVAVRADTKAEAEKIGPEIPCLVTLGPPTGTGYGGRARAHEVLAYWPTLIPREAVKPEVVVEEVRC